MARIKFETAGLTFEVEGSEDFVRDAYKRFKDDISALPHSEIQSVHPTVSRTTSASKSKKTSKGQKIKNIKPKEKKLQSRTTFTFINDKAFLKLSDFYSKKEVSSSLKRNAVFVYFLQKVSKINGITINHVYTCYKTLKLKPPTNLYQSLIDTKNKHNFIDTKDMENITLTHHGENFVDHEITTK